MATTFPTTLARIIIILPCLPLEHILNQLFYNASIDTCIRVGQSRCTFPASSVEYRLAIAGSYTIGRHYGRTLILALAGYGLNNQQLDTGQPFILLVATTLSDYPGKRCIISLPFLCFCRTPCFPSISI